MRQGVAKAEPESIVIEIVDEWGAIFGCRGHIFTMTVVSF